MDGKKGCQIRCLCNHGVVALEKKNAIVRYTYVSRGCKIWTCLMEKSSLWTSAPRVGRHCSLSRYPGHDSIKGTIHYLAPRCGLNYEDSQASIESAAIDRGLGTKTTQWTHFVRSRQLEQSRYATPARSHRESASPIPSPTWSSFAYQWHEAPRVYHARV